MLSEQSPRAESNSRISGVPRDKIEVPRPNLVSLDGAFDASLVPGTFLKRFLDFKRLIDKFLKGPVIIQVGLVCPGCHIRKMPLPDPSVTRVGWWP